MGALSVFPRAPPSFELIFLPPPLSFATYPQPTVALQVYLCVTLRSPCCWSHLSGGVAIFRNFSLAQMPRAIIERGKLHWNSTIDEYSLKSNFVHVADQIMQLLPRAFK